MDPLWIVFAFVCGYLVQRVGLPPMVGFLLAGFGLDIAGVEGGSTLQGIADFGVTLLLFTIGLKLQLKSLARPEIWAGASVHMLVTVVVMGGALFLISAAGISMIADLSLGLCFFIAFALSFSSTVFAVKVLQESGETESLHGRTAVGILVMQDLFAVFFMVFAAGKAPSPWALALLGLPLLRPLLGRILEKSGHGEMLVLMGMVMAGAAYAGFDALGVKGDLGAIAVGMLLASHPKAGELAKSLLSLKDLLLVGFFLSIGLAGLPSLEVLIVAIALGLAVPFKVGLFFFLLTRFRLRARTSFLTSLNLANYSEFGLIVGAVGLANGWIGQEWLVLLAVAVSITFIAAAPLNTKADKLYLRWKQRLARFESPERLPEDARLDPGDARVVIFGMVGVGTGAYDKLVASHGGRVLGIDHDPELVKKHQDAGRDVIRGAGTDPDFWKRVERADDVRLVMLATDSHEANVNIARQLQDSRHEDFVVAATCYYDDQAEELRALGVDAVFNTKRHAGAGFADHVLDDFQARLDAESAA